MSGCAARQRSSCLLDILAFADRSSSAAAARARRRDAAGADRACRPRSGCMRQFARQEAGERHLELRVGEEEDALAGELEAMRLERGPRTRLAGRDDLDRTARRRCFQARAAARSHSVVPSAPSGKVAAKPLRAALFRVRAPYRRGTAAPGESVLPARPPAARRRAVAAGNATGPMPSSSKKPPELILDDIGKRADDEQRSRLSSEPASASSGTRAARQASSPWVKVVSMPLPE